MDDWFDISSAPKDGTVIHAGWRFEDDTEMQEWFTVKWDSSATNALYPGKVGMWTAPDGSFTWNDDRDGGPTHWRKP